MAHKKGDGLIILDKNDKSTRAYDLNMDSWLKAGGDGGSQCKLYANLTYCQNNSLIIIRILDYIIFEPKTSLLVFRKMLS